MAIAVDKDLLNRLDNVFGVHVVIDALVRWLGLERYGPDEHQPQRGCSGHDQLVCRHKNSSYAVCRMAICKEGTIKTKAGADGGRPAGSSRMFF